jgi:hypothetical protein
MQMRKILHMEAVVVAAMGATTATPLEALLEVVAAAAAAVVAEVAVAVAVVAVAVPQTAVPLRDSWWCNPFARKQTSV